MGREFSNISEIKRGSRPGGSAFKRKLPHTHLSSCMSSRTTHVQDLIRLQSESQKGAGHHIPLFLTEDRIYSVSILQITFWVMVPEVPIDTLLVADAFLELGEAISIALIYNSKSCPSELQPSRSSKD